MPVSEVAGVCRKGCTGPILRNIQRLGRLGRIDCRSAPKAMFDSLPLTTASGRKMASKDSRYDAVACLLAAFMMVTQPENHNLAFASAAAASASVAASPCLLCCTVKNVQRCTFPAAKLCHQH